MVYVIRNWKGRENHRTREVKTLRWVPVPTRFGDEFFEVVHHPNGAAHWGCWIILQQIAAAWRGEVRRDDGRPHTVRSLELTTRIPAELWTEVLERLVALEYVEAVEHETAAADSGKLVELPVPIALDDAEESENIEEAPDASRDILEDFATSRDASRSVRDTARRVAPTGQDRTLQDSPPPPISPPSLRRGAIAREDGFAEFREAALKAGMGGGEWDWRVAASVWRNLDFEQRQAAIQGILRRMGVPEDSVLKVLPQNYLTRRLWDRPIRSPTVASSATSKTAFLRQLAEGAGDFRSASSDEITAS